ncbi:MAG: hypothetical protein PHN72_04420 [Bacilli bacterium]|nr:hypothetical protein [Bacilli bacterium]
MIRKESKFLLHELFDYNEQIKIKQFKNIVTNNPNNVVAQSQIWEYDQSLLGLGGYAAPLNATMNFYNTYGDYRNVYRSLQYGRIYIFLNISGRSIITNSGLHLETISKLLIKKFSKIPVFRNTKAFGKNIQFLYSNKIIDEKLYNYLKYYINVYNFAKHDTDSENNISFDLEDGIIFYFCSRKLGNELLKILGNRWCYCNERFEICNVVDYEELKKNYPCKEIY